VQDGLGASPFITACVFNTIAVAEMLIAAGADTTLRDTAGCTGFAGACMRASSDMVRFLLRVLPDMCEEERVLASVRSVRGGDLDVIRALHEHGFPFSSPCTSLENATPAFIAAQEGDLEIIELLHSWGETLTIETSEVRRRERVCV
jgi:ankyrin repeat protein